MYLIQTKSSNSSISSISPNYSLLPTRYLDKNVIYAVIHVVIRLSSSNPSLQLGGASVNWRYIFIITSSGT